MNERDAPARKRAPSSRTTPFLPQRLQPVLDKCSPFIGYCCYTYDRHIVHTASRMPAANLTGPLAQGVVTTRKKTRTGRNKKKKKKHPTRLPILPSAPQTDGTKHHACTRTQRVGSTATSCSAKTHRQEHHADSEDRGEHPQTV